MLDVFAIATPEARHNDKPLTPEQEAEVTAGTLVPMNQWAWYRIDADAAYPATFAHIAALTARPPEPLGQLWDRAQRIGLHAFEGVDGGTPGDPVRAEALEIARLWFTEMLHQAVGKPLGPHWVGSKQRWKQ